MSEHTRTVFLDSGDQTLTLKKFVLTVLDGPNKGQKAVFGSRAVQVGSSPEVDFAVDDPAVSRFHAQVVVDEGGYHLKDRGSKNGTWVSGVRINDVYLESEMNFTVGGTVVRFELTDEDVDIVFSGRKRLGNLIGQSMEMRRIFALVERVAPTDATVLIQGESGTGKELIAEAVHTHSHRKDKPFVVFDCSAVPRELIGSELFGHVKGAFTGATGYRKGAFEQASGGTLFLDELGELELELQPQLLRVLEKREVRPVGGNQTIKVDVRIVAATNRNLIHEVKEGNFREDLYYRFDVVRLQLPPLRDRTEDVAVLVGHFLDQISEQTGRKGLNISYKTMEKLKLHKWPGNVRELKNFVERAALLAEGDRLETRYLNYQPQQRAAAEVVDTSASFAQEAADQEIPFKEAKNRLVEDFEKTYWMKLLARTDGNVSKAARIAGVHRKSLEYILKKLDLTRDDVPG